MKERDGAEQSLGEKRDADPYDQRQQAEQPEEERGPLRLRRRESARPGDALLNAL